MPFGLSIEEVGLFLFLAGLIVGLGAVTVIDVHGFLGRHSPYWTETTIRAHKVTKPLIWLGMALAISGGILLYRDTAFAGIARWHAAFAAMLVLNGCYLSFVVSPALLMREKTGKARELLPMRLQRRIILSFLVSLVGWWGSVALLVRYLLAA